MTPQIARIAVLVSAVSISALFLMVGGVLYSFAAILVAAGVPTLFQVVFRTGERRGRHDLLRAIEHRRANYRSEGAVPPYESHRLEFRPEDPLGAHQAHQKAWP